MAGSSSVRAYTGLPTATSTAETDQKGLVSITTVNHPHTPCHQLQLTEEGPRVIDRELNHYQPADRGRSQDE